MLVEIIPWVLSSWTLMTMWLAGNKSSWAWVSGLTSQFLWLAFNITYEAWGLIPLSFALMFVYSRNLRKWQRKPVIQQATA